VIKELGDVGSSFGEGSSSIVFCIILLDFRFQRFAENKFRDHHPKKEPASSETGLFGTIYLPIRGGSRNAIAKNKTPIAKAKIKIYATLSMMVSQSEELKRVEANDPTR
jgi:hypothetical protein